MTLRTKIALSHLVVIIVVAGLVLAISNERYDHERNFLIVVGIMIIFASLFFGLILSNHVTLALKRVVRAVQEIAAGDLEHRIPVVRGIAELDSLVRAFNHMAERLEENMSALRESEEKYSVAVQNVNNGILIVQDEKIVFSNNAYSNITGYSADEVAGMCFLDLVIPESVNFVSERYNRLVRGEEEPVTIEIRHVRKDGRIGYLEVHAGLIEYKSRKAALLVLRDITERKEHEKRLRNLSGQIIRVQEQERKRIAHELHDEIGQSLTAIGLSADLLLRHQKLPVSADYIPKICEDIKVVVGKTIDDIHRISSNLRPYVLDTLGLVPALRWYSKAFQERSGINVDFQTESQSERLSPALETLVYRVTQEALTNVLKHAQAEKVLILFNCTPRMLKIVIEDDGRGFDVEHVLTGYHTGKGKLGIFGMKERVSAFGGTFAIVSGSGKGVRITIELASPYFREEQGGMYDKDTSSSC